MCVCVWSVGIVQINISELPVVYIDVQYKNECSMKRKLEQT